MQKLSFEVVRALKTLRFRLHLSNTINDARVSLCWRIFCLWRWHVCSVAALRIQLSPSTGAGYNSFDLIVALLGFYCFCHWSRQLYPSQPAQKAHMNAVHTWGAIDDVCTQIAMPRSRPFPQFSTLWNSGQSFMMNKLCSSKVFGIEHHVTMVNQSTPLISPSMTASKIWGEDWIELEKFRLQCWECGDAYQGVWYMSLIVRRSCGVGVNSFLTKSRHSGDRSKPGGKVYSHLTILLLTTLFSSPGEDLSCTHAKFRPKSAVICLQLYNQCLKASTSAQPKRKLSRGAERAM